MIRSDEGLTLETSLWAMYIKNQIVLLCLG